MKHFPSHYNHLKFFLEQKTLKVHFKLINPFQASAVFHTETSYLICSVKEMTGFFMECYTELKSLRLMLPLFLFLREISRLLFIYGNNRSSHQKCSIKKCCS